MSAVHLHLISNHLPIIFPFIGVIILLIGGIINSSVTIRVALFMFVLGSVFTIPAFFSGEEAEHIVEHIPGIEEHYIEEHEEIAEKFALVSYLLGGIALVALWANWKEKSFTKTTTIVTTIIAIITIVLAFQTGKTGGEIRHPEIRAIEVSE